MKKINMYDKDYNHKELLKIYKHSLWSYGGLSGKATMREFLEVVAKNRGYYVVTKEKVTDLNKAMKGVGGLEKIYTLKSDEGGSMKLTERQFHYFQLFRAAFISGLTPLSIFK
jgi:hypothetical protein